MIITGLEYTGVGDLKFEQRGDNLSIESSKPVSCKVDDSGLLSITGKSTHQVYGNSLVINGTVYSYNVKNDRPFLTTFERTLYSTLIGSTTGLILDTLLGLSDCFVLPGLVIGVVYGIAKHFLPINTINPHQVCESDKEDDVYKRKWTLENSHASFESMDITGTGNVSLPCNLISERELTMIQTGTTDVLFEASSSSPYNTERVKIECSGTGSIRVAGKYKINSLRINTYGTGSVRGFHAIRECSLSAEGCTSISITKSKHCQISRKSAAYCSKIHIGTC